MRDSDATILLDEHGAEVSIGTERAMHWARQHGKPILVVDLDDPQALARADAWLVAQRRRFGNDMTLGIGGPRESEAPGTYRRALLYLRGLFDTPMP